MRRVLIPALMVALLCSACASRPPAEQPVVQEPAPPPASDSPSDTTPVSPAPMCTGEFAVDLDRLRHGPADEVLSCAAEIAAHNPEYRRHIAYWLVVNRGKVDVVKPGYRAFIDTTRWSFGQPRTVPAPEGWRLRDAQLSPDGRYVAASLADGTVGWFAVDGSGHARHDAQGYDLIWHPAEARFAYISDGRLIHLVSPGPDETHEVLEAPVEHDLRYPYFTMGKGPWTLQGLERGTVVAVVDPQDALDGIAYHPESGTWEHFDGHMIPQTWEKIIVPPWIAQPWHPQEVLLVTLWVDRPVLGHPDAGTPRLFYRLTEGAEPVSLTWSPSGLAYAIVERRDSRLVADILLALRDDPEHRFSLKLESPLIAVSDDGVTTVTVSGSAVTARNHLAGGGVVWHLEGEVVNVRLTGSALLIVQADRVMVVPYGPQS